MVLISPFLSKTLRDEDKQERERGEIKSEHGASGKETGKQQRGSKSVDFSS